MSVELQITGAALAATLERSLRQQLRSTCLAPLAGASIDHLDVVRGSATTQLAGPFVQVRVPVDVFIVLDSALDAAPNATPAGATTSAGTAAFVFQLQVTLSDALDKDGNVVTTSLLQLIPEPPDLGTLSSSYGAAATAVGQQLAASLSVVSIDLSPQLALLGVTRVQTAAIVLVDDVVAVRFDAPGAPVTRLFPGQQWGLFVDGATVETLLRTKLAPAQSALPGASLDVAWAPAGTTAHADISLSTRVSIGPFGARIVAEMPCDFSVLTGAAPALRGTVDWSVHVYAGVIPGFVEHIAENLLSDAIHPASFGATPLGARSFAFDVALPPIPLLGVTLRYDSVFGSPDGMTIGGAVVIPGVYEPAFTITVGALSGPFRLQLCSKNAASGSGAPSKSPLTLSNTTSYGDVAIEGCGALCEIDVVTPSPQFRFFMTAPTGTVLESASVNVALPYTIADAMTQPLTFIIRTPRGVRLIDLGLPPKAQLDANGRLLNGHDTYLNDCLTYVPLGDGSLALQWGGDVSVLKPPPLENPDWDAYLRQGYGLVVQLVRANGLEPGELVRMRSATHAIDVVADARGRALVPVFLPIAATLGAVTMKRANGSSLEGHVGVGSAAFENPLSLPGRLASGLELTPSGNVRVAVRAGRMTTVHTVTTLGPVDFSDPNSQAGDLNPQPLPPGPPPERLRELAERSGIHGIAQAVFVPGFASSGAAVATMIDGTKLMLDVGHADVVRITGTFAGPIGAIDVAGPWAVSATRRETTLLRFSGAPRTFDAARTTEAP